MIIAGVDDAGRGSVLGPLVIAGVTIDESKIPHLVDLGVKDSKLLTPKKRQELYDKMRNICTRIVWKRIDASEIDRVVFNGKKLFRLNYLEAQVMASILSRLKYDAAYVDCCDTNQVRFGCLISDLIAEKRGRRFTVGERNPLADVIRSEHHADRIYPIVSAASIVAKVTRDAFIKKLHKEHGLFGSGYPSDKRTVSYLKKALKSSHGLPPFTRLSWLTIRRLGENSPDLEKMQSLRQNIKS